MANTKNKNNESVIDKKFLFRTSYRWLLGSQMSWNYERMMAPGYLYANLPFYKEKYKDDEEKLQKRLKANAQFFNVNPQMGHFILGVNLAIEDEEGFGAAETVTGLKTGLMGPFAGVGDTIFGVLIPTIFGSIAAYMGLEGNVTGVVLFMLALLAVTILRFTFIPIGYNLGLGIVEDFSDQLSALTEAATVLGITVVGALIPTVVTANLDYVYEAGEVTLELQEIFDQIMPALVPAALVGLVYWLLGKKWMNSTRAIVLIMVLSIVLYNLNILA